MKTITSNIRIGALIRMGSFIGIGALINKNTFADGGRGLIRKGALIGRRALNRIIMVFCIPYHSQQFL